MQRTPGVTESDKQTAMSGGAHQTVIFVLSALVVIAHVLGAYRMPGWMWGANAYAFLPGFGLPVALLVAGLSAVALWREPVAWLHRIRVSAGPATGIAAVLALIAFWLARSRQILLGDGIPLLANLPYETSLHAREPLMSFLHQRAFALASWYAPARDAHEVARDVVAMNSAVAGLLFLLVALRLAIALTHGLEGRDAGPARLLLTGLLLTQGYATLFFGYIENYAFLALGLAAFLWSGLLFTQRRVPLLAPAAVLIVTIALHLSAVTVLPGLLVLGIIGVLDPQRRLAVLRDLALGLLLLAGLTWVLYVAGGHYRLDHELIRVVERTMSDLGYMFSVNHYRDFFNEHLLIGPFALLWLVPTLVLGAMRGAWRSPAVVFVVVTAIFQAAACWIVPDLPLGYARDWDLFAPAGVVFVSAAAAIMLAQAGSHVRRARLLGMALVVSLFHTVPWIALNASEERSLERFKTLPLGRGRTESTVGFWYFAQGDLPQAKLWLNRALEEDPGNVRALAHLGNIQLSERRFDLAAASFARAVELRPNQPRLREGLITAQFALGQYQSALAHSEVAVNLEPDRATHWAMTGLVWLGIGGEEEARQALLRAIELDPAEAAFRRALDDVGEPGALERIVARDWPAFRKE